MSALTDLFTAMANKIRSKTRELITYTPSEMVSYGIDDVFDAGVASATTPITPSNSSPASMTANTGYKPTANGYAISSYDSVTPSSNPESVSSGDIVKIGGSGVIVDSIPVPPSVTPSNASPAALTSGSAVTPSANGYAIESYSSITPSNSSPATITSGNIYKATANGAAVQFVSTLAPSVVTPDTITSGYVYKATGNGYAIDTYPTDITPSNSSPANISSGIFRTNSSGYAISSYDSKTPSDSTPPTVASGDIVKMGGAGYLYETLQAKVATGTITGKAGNLTINIGFKPSYICVSSIGPNSYKSCNIYIYTRGTSKIYYGDNSTSLIQTSFGDVDRITAVTTDGFRFYYAGSTRTTSVIYFAVE